MKKLFHSITVIAVILVAMLGMSNNAYSLGGSQLASAAGITAPVKQVVVYQSQSVAYDNFNAAIFAQGQLSNAVKLPSGSPVSLYVDANKVNGPVGLNNGARCSTTQSSTDYYQNTITMDKRFCADFNDAILDGRAVYGLVPTEAVFLHKANGERCYVTGNGGGVYLINPASTFFKNYLVNRISEKLMQFNLNTLFLDNLQAGWNGITSRCGGAPKEYSSSSTYLTQMIGLAQYLNDNLPDYKIEGNLANATSEWDKFFFLDGAMCENCFTNWGGSWPSTSDMLSDLSIINKWVESGHKIYVVSQAPDISAASNRFTFAASLLVANADKVYFHFGADYGQFYDIPEYKYDLGLPTAAHTCNGNICTRSFEYGIVTVDFGSRIGMISTGTTGATPTPAFPTPIPTLMSPTPTATLPLPTATISTPTPTITSPTATVLVSPTTTLTNPITPTATSQPTNTAVTQPGTNVVGVRVSSGNNDVEEYSSGKMYVDSSDLELIYDGRVQIVGIRFTDVRIPAGAIITNAYIQFKADQASSKAVQLTISGEASANAAVFTAASRNVSVRAKTSSSVPWSPPAWSKNGDAGPSQRTPNLSAVVQEIIQNPKWTSGNSLAIIITGKSTNKRTAKSFEGDAAGAPWLHIEFTLPTHGLAAASAATLPATATATLAMPSPTNVPVIITLEPIQILQSPTFEVTTTEVVVPTETPSPTPIPLSPATEVIVPTETPIPAVP